MAIDVTKPFLPSRDEYSALLAGIWDRNWLTNHGPLVAELERQLASYIDVPSMQFTTNGTIALQIAIKALDLKGEVLTTPFSYVATTSTIVWEGCVPKMVDICPETLNIDPDRLEAAITPQTTGIIATHVYGNACDVHAIREIADRRGLRVIYDAAHAFGSTMDDQSLYRFGDIATASFHATKLFHTVEGGGVFSADPALMRKMAALKNFGHESPTSFSCVGINGKNSEFHAAMGLCNLQHIAGILEQRRVLSERYDANLGRLDLRRPAITPGCGYNHAYYPVIFRDEAMLLLVSERLKRQDVNTRRYFYPSLDTLCYLDDPGTTPVSRDIAARVLCLPMYHALTLDQVDRISDVVQGCFARAAA